MQVPIVYLAFLPVIDLNLDLTFLCLFLVEHAIVLIFCIDVLQLGLQGNVTLQLLSYKVDFENFREVLLQFVLNKVLLLDSVLFHRFLVFVLLSSFLSGLVLLNLLLIELLHLLQHLPLLLGFLEKNLSILILLFKKLHLLLEFLELLLDFLLFLHLLHLQLLFLLLQLLMQLTLLYFFLFFTLLLGLF